MSLFGGRKRDPNEPEQASEAGPDRTTASESTAPAAGSPSRSGSFHSAGADRRARHPNREVKGDKSVANIGKSIVFKGDLTGDEDIEIEGTIEGRIDLPKNQLTIGANGRVKAEINAKDVVVIGRVTGNVSATDRLEIQSSGVVEGDIRAPRLLIQEGAVVNGAIEMSAKAGEGSASKAQPSSPAPAPPAQAARTA